MYNLWQVEPTEDKMSHNGNSIDGEQILSKYHENTILREDCRTTEDFGHSFNIHLIEKVRSDEKLLQIQNHFKWIWILLTITCSSYIGKYMQYIYELRLLFILLTDVS